MKKFIYNFLRKYIQEHYDTWGTKIETDLPPEFIISEHALERLQQRFNCNPDKYHKIMLKAWNTQEQPSYQFIKEAKIKYEQGIYKIFHGHIFVFRTRYNRRLGFAQKYLITVFRKDGYQIYN